MKEAMWWIFGFLFAVSAVALRAVAVWLMWAWFVQPLGVPRIAYGQAVGLVLLINLLIHPGSLGTGFDMQSDTRVSIADMLFGPLVVIAFGALVYAYIR